MGGVTGRDKSWCPGRDLNPHDQRSTDFKSVASTNFATRAVTVQVNNWRRGSESNRRTRSCSPLHNHSATAPLNWFTKKKPRRNRGFRKLGAGNEIRTRDPNLGKVVLYQLSYSRFFSAPNHASLRGRILLIALSLSSRAWLFFLIFQHFD